MTTLRVFWIGWVVHFKIVSRSPFAIGVGATWPIVNATLAYFMYRAGGHPRTLLYASLGSAVFQFPISLYEAGICATGFAYFGPTEHPSARTSPMQRIAKMLQETDF